MLCYDFFYRIFYSVSWFGHLRWGQITAVLKATGPVPEESDKFIIFKMESPRTVNSLSGSGTNTQVVCCATLTSFVKLLRDFFFNERGLSGSC